MEQDIFWIGVFAFPIAVIALFFAFSGGYIFNQEQFIINESNVSLNETWLSEFANVTYINNTYINQTLELNSTQFETGEPATIKESWLTSFIEGVSKWSNYWTKTENINQTGYNITADYFIGNGSQLTGIPSPDLSAYLTLDQTTPQTISDGAPLFSEGLGISADNKKITFGAGNDLDVYFDGSWGRMKTSSSIPLLIGPTPTHLTLNAGGDGVGIVTSVTTNTPTARGLTVWSEYNGSIGTRSNPTAGINAFAHIYGADTLSGTINGGTTAGRYVVRHYGTGTISSANGISVLTTWGGVGKGTLTTAKGVQIEDVPVTTGRAIGDYIDLSCGNGVQVNGGSVTSRTGVDIKTSSKASGTFTNQYGVHIEELSGADNNYEILLDSAGSIFFRDSAIHIDSLNDGYLDLTADTSIRLNALVDAGANTIRTTGDVNATSLIAQNGFTGNCVNASYVSGIVVGCND